MIGAAMDELVESKKARQGQLKAFGELLEAMRDGVPPYGRLDPADEVLAVWRRGQRPPIGS